MEQSIQNKSTKIILLMPPILFEKWGWENAAPTGLLELASNLYDLPIEVEIRDLNKDFIKNKSEEDQFSRFKRFSIKFVEEFKNSDQHLIFGFSTFSSQFYISTIYLAKLIREKLPKSIIMVGGYHVNYFPDDFKFPRKIYGKDIESKLFDYIFLGEADKKLPEVILELISSNKIKSDSSLKTKIVDCGPILTLDELPLVNFSRIAQKLDKIITIPIFCSRGCPHNCSFCSDYRNYDPLFKGKKWRLKSPQRSYEEIKNVIKIMENTKSDYQIQIFDPLFGNPEWRVKLFEILIENKIDAEIFAEIRLDNFNIKMEKNYLEKLNLSFSMGLESGSPTMLKIMKKSQNPKKYLKQAIEVIDLLEETGNYALVNILFGHPGETMKTLTESMNYLDKLFKKRNNCIPSVSKYILIPNSYVYRNMAEFTKNYGTNFRYPYYWMMPYHFDITSTAVDPSANLNAESVIKIGTEWQINTIRNAIRNLGCLKNRKFIFDRYKFIMATRHLTRARQANKNAEHYYDTVEDSKKIWKNTCDFWNNEF